MILNEYCLTEHSRFSEHSRIHPSVNIHFAKENIKGYDAEQKKESYNILSEVSFQKELDDFFSRMDDLKIDDDSPSDVINNYASSEQGSGYVDKHPSLEQISFIYVVSNHIYSQQNMYKIGKHKGTKKMLIKRYKTYLIEPIVYFFFPTGNASQDESILLDRVSKFRVGTSEFVRMPIDKLLDCIHFHFRSKYQRCPAVQIPYHRCLYKRDLYDFFDKSIQNKRCSFLPYLEFSDPMSCLKKIEFNLDSKIIYTLDISHLENKMDFLIHPVLVSFLRSFMIDFDRMNYVMYLDKFLPNGFNQFLVELMKRVYGYHSFKEMSRREFLQKESYPERLILIRKSEEPIEMLLEKIRWINSCVLIEDKNIYSIQNEEFYCDDLFENLFYYFFYSL